MSTQNLLAKYLKDIVDIARLAPTVHNTQPFKIKVTGEILEVKLDPAFTLAEGDPTGRQTYISLGIFIEAMLLAASRYNLKPSDLSVEEKCAKVRFKTLVSSSVDEKIKLLEKRSTDRSVYQPITITKDISKAIKNAYISKKVRIHVLTQKTEINKIADLTARGIAVALNNPSFRKELSHYLILPWSKKKRGISVNSLYISTPLAVIEPMLMRLGLGLSAETKLEKKRWESASAVVAFTSEGDMPEYWFEVGRAYLNASLLIEKLGLSQATSAATVEASNYHEDVSEMLGTDQRLQSVIRIGRGSNKRAYSPRVDAEELIIT